MVTWWLELPFSDPIHQMSFNTTQHNQPCPKQSRTVYPDLPRVKFCLTCFSWETHPWKWLTPCIHIGPSKNNHQKNIHAELKYFLMVYLGNRTWSLKWAAANRNPGLLFSFLGGRKGGYIQPRVSIGAVLRILMSLIHEHFMGYRFPLVKF